MSNWRPPPYEFDMIDLEEADKEYPALLDTVRREFPHLSEEDQIKIVSMVVDHCPYCHEEGRGCVCWNDE